MKFDKINLDENAAAWQCQRVTVILISLQVGEISYSLHELKTNRDSKQCSLLQLCYGKRKTEPEPFVNVHKKGNDLININNGNITITG